MKRAIITVDLGFGDAGKGATVDLLCKETQAELVVRYCGGHQAGHNVHLSDGRSHCFSQWGSGTFRGASTWLGPMVIVDPLAMVNEAAHLVSQGVSHPWDLLHLDPRCLVTVPYHKTLNRIKELSRENPHGSCGVGIGETRKGWLDHGGDVVTAGDLFGKNLPCLVGKLELLRQRCLLEVAEKKVGGVGGTTFPSAVKVAHALLNASDEWRWGKAPMPDAETVIFEGAQGVLIDEWTGFHPHTTWSTVTQQHALEILEENPPEEVCALGIVRAYMVRHGAGPLPTFDAGLTERMWDPNNPENEWQGKMRCGWLDLPLLRHVARNCRGPLDGLVVNHLDQVGKGFKVCVKHPRMLESWLTHEKGTFSFQDSMAMHLFGEGKDPFGEFSWEKTDPVHTVKLLSEIAPFTFKSYLGLKAAPLKFRKWPENLPGCP